MPEAVPRVPDAVWAEVALLLGPAAVATNSRRYPPRDLLDAILYRLVTGCAWRKLPQEFPPPSAVYRVYRRWEAAGWLVPVLLHLSRTLPRHVAGTLPAGPDIPPGA